MDENGSRPGQVFGADAPEIFGKEINESRYHGLYYTLKGHVGLAFFEYFIWLA